MREAKLDSRRVEKEKNPPLEVLGRVVTPIANIYVKAGLAWSCRDERGSRRPKMTPDRPARLGLLNASFLSNFL